MKKHSIDEEKLDENCDWEVEVFFDGDCPLCLREINLLRWLDRKSKIRLTDVADPAFTPSILGLTMKEFMAQIQGRLTRGQWITGAEVFRRLYAAIGVKPAVDLTRLPGIAQGLDFAYRFFAKYRLRFTGRCGDGVCKVD